MPLFHYKPSKSGVDNIYGSFEKYKKPGVVLIENVDLVSLRLTSESFSKRII
jgi:hypothetical protein